ncbi:hypothetical protein MFIFM68171_04723 [Madurella fahalii]|uniref:Gag protein n=1 Tax=Madurella fahalii TaxID=1157608 RepID=A0ABQ0G9S1_9PEZI
MCNVTEPPQEEDVEDGISESIITRLIMRGDGTKVGTWRALWETLFPRDTEIPSSEYEDYLVAETHEFLKAAEQARIQTIEHLRPQFAKILRNDTLASQLIALADDSMRNSFTNCHGELERRALQEILSSSTATGSGPGQSTKSRNSKRQKQAGGTQGQRPPPSPSARIAPKSNITSHLSSSQPAFEPHVLRVHTPQATGSGVMATPVQDSTSRMDNLFQLANWVTNGPTYHNSPIDMQQGRSTSANALPPHQPPSFYTHLRQPAATQAQSHGTFTYVAEPGGYYQGTQESFDNWQHMPGSDIDRRES